MAERLGEDARDFSETVAQLQDTVAEVVEKCEDEDGLESSEVLGVNGAVVVQPILVKLFTTAPDEEGFTARSVESSEKPGSSVFSYECLLGLKCISKISSRAEEGRAPVHGSTEGVHNPSSYQIRSVAFGSNGIVVVLAHHAAVGDRVVSDAALQMFLRGSVILGHGPYGSGGFGREVLE